MKQTKKQQRVQQIAEDILETFRNGAVPKALAQIFIRRGTCGLSEGWSWRNRLTIAAYGHSDARGFRQWKKVGRSVKKGAKAIYILGPCKVKKKPDEETTDDAEADVVIVGFVPIPVFGYEQTEGDPLPGREDAVPFIDALPLIEVARAWGLEVVTYPGRGKRKLGFYTHGQRIGLGVENVSTWGHELVHGADDRLGTLTKAPGQQLDNEVVAELGGAILLECLGYETESDRGGAYKYIESYAKAHGRHVLSVCTELLDRTCACVAFLLDTAERLANQSEQHRLDSSTAATAA